MFRPCLVLWSTHPVSIIVRGVSALAVTEVQVAAVMVAMTMRWQQHSGVSGSSAAVVGASHSDDCEAAGLVV